MNYHDILIHVMGDCRRHGVKLVLSAQEYLDDKTVGWFSAVPNTKIDEHELVIATGRPIDDWMPTLLHEYNHMQQWLEDPVLFARRDVLEGKVFEWIDHKIELTDVEADEACIEAARLELDAEKRTVQLIKDWAITDIIDPVVYAQKGVAYGNFYKAVRRFRKWYRPDSSPYRIDQIRMQFPTEIDPEWLPTEHHMKLYESCL